jgi:hypothetical protein
MRKRLTVAALALACCCSFGVAQAQAVEYAKHVEVAGGGNHFGPFVLLFLAETFPFGSALPCAGVRGVGLNCSTKEGEVATIELPFDVEAEPYIHNHSTFTSYFSGFYYR